MSDPRASGGCQDQDIARKLNIGSILEEIVHGSRLVDQGGRPLHSVVWSL
jgi:hypothetical protein